MKSALLGLTLLGALCAVLFFAAPAQANAVLRRAVAYFDPVPRLDRESGPESAAPAPAALQPLTAGATPEWRLADREASRVYEAGDFSSAALAWGYAAEKAPPGDALRIRARADRANVYRLLTEGVSPAADADAARDEAEYRRRLDALKNPTAGSYLEIADFAASRGLHRHLAFLYERAFEKKNSGSGDEVQKKVSKVFRQRKTANASPSRDVLESLIRELPTSEAADIAREETGHAASGIGSVSVRGGGGAVRAEDPVKLAEARKLQQKGDAEYRLAVPGSKDVNVHRRAALDACIKARDLFEEVDRRSGVQGHQAEIHDLNRNIAELRKDLPIGK